MKYIGQSIPGLTTRTLVSGHGSYVADLQVPGMCALAVLHSPYAHASPHCHLAGYPRCAACDRSEA
jgi:CO/xanthine dehydrogenase Mo-binding subunit